MAAQVLGQIASATSGTTISGRIRVRQITVYRAPGGTGNIITVRASQPGNTSAKVTLVNATLANDNWLTIYQGPPIEVEDLEIPSDTGTQALLVAYLD